MTVFTFFLGASVTGGLFFVPADMIALDFVCTPRFGSYGFLFGVMG
jgi:hypothetical protein